jgi:arylsulfatase A-like enzyme
VDLLAQPVDILPTLLDLAGLEVEPPDPFHGRSFAPALHGEGQEPLRQFAASGQFLRLQNGELPRTATIPMLYTPRWAYTPCGPDGGRELYDLAVDPGAEQNVAAEYPQVARDFHEQLVGWLQDLGASAAAGAFLPG